MEMGSTSVSYKGYTKYMPTKIMNPDTKELTLEYLIDEKWHNYKSLYLWMNSTEGNINKTVKDETIAPITPNMYLPLRIYLLDNFKHKVI
jgi:hypothetical protein